MIKKYMYYMLSIMIGNLGNYCYGMGNVNSSLPVTKADLERSIRVSYDITSKPPEYPFSELDLALMNLRDRTQQIRDNKELSAQLAIIKLLKEADKQIQKLENMSVITRQ